MAISVITINPENNRIDITIDSSIVIEFSDPIDPFTVANGITLYTKTDSLWTGPDLATLDTKYSDVLDIGEVDTFYPLNYYVNGNTVEISPSVSLIPDREHFICIYPGNDVTRFVSKRTVGTPIMVTAPGNKIDMSSSYAGITEDTFEIVFSSSDGEAVDTISVSKGITYIGDFQFVTEEEVNIGELKFILSGNFDIGDTISLPVFPAEGASSIYQTKFTTSKYTVTNPRSNKIEYFSDIEDPIRVIKTTPENLSFGNKSINPIVIKFNKGLDLTQDLVNKIKIKRTGLDTGSLKSIVQYYKMEADTLKIYMISTSR